MNATKVQQLNDTLRTIGYRARDIKNNTDHARAWMRDLTSPIPEVVASAEKALPEAILGIIRDAKAIASEMPNVQAQLDGVAQEDINERERELDRLGMTIRVRYVGPTDTMGGRYVAEVCGDSDKARVYVSSQLHDRDENSRLAAAEKCVQKWHSNRVAWWKANAPGEWVKAGPVIHSRAYSGDAWLFFAR